MGRCTSELWRRKERERQIVIFTNFPFLLLTDEDVNPPKRIDGISIK